MKGIDEALPQTNEMAAVGMTIDSFVNLIRE